MVAIKQYLVAILLCISWFNVTAQKTQTDKRLEKAYKYIDDDKYDDAAKYLEKMLASNQDYGDGWDLLVKLRYSMYEKSKKEPNLLGNISITATTKDKDGKEVPADDSLTKNLQEMLKSMSPAKMAYNRFMNAARKGTMFSNEAYESSVYLRMMNIDTEVDSNVSKKALKYFKEAEDEFVDKNYNQAAQLYNRALQEQPDFYKAALYLGDSYYASGNYTNALTAFKDASKRHPNLLEPHKYLLDTYYKLKMYDKAYEEGINTLCVYPDLTVAARTEDAAYMNGQAINIPWTAREAFPNKMPPVKKDINMTDDSIAVKGPWVWYKGAYNKIKKACDNKGIIIKTTPLTQSRYMEVYSWEEMLKNSTDKSLDQAREMQKQGFLDCYVLLTCFHYDIYDQYHDFALRNKDKIMKYYKTFTRNRQ